MQLACRKSATSGLMHRSNFAVEEPHLPALRPHKGPSPAMADPPPGSPPTSFASKAASSPSTGTCLRTRRPRPNPSAGCRCSATGSPLTLPHHVLGSWLFAAALAQAQQLKHDAELIAASTLLHDIGLTAAFTGEVRFEITIGSGLQLDRSSVHFSSGLKISSDRGSHR